MVDTYGNAFYRYHYWWTGGHCSQTLPPSLESGDIVLGLLRCRDYLGELQLVRTWAVIDYPHHPNLGVVGRVLRLKPDGGSELTDQTVILQAFDRLLATIRPDERRVKVTDYNWETLINRYIESGELYLPEDVVNCWVSYELQKEKKEEKMPDKPAWLGKPLTLNELIAEPEEKDDSCEEEESHYKGSDYRGGVPECWDDSWEEEDGNDRWSPDVGGGCLIATCAEKGRNWDWWLVVNNDGGGYRLEYGQNCEYPDARNRPALGDDFDSPGELNDPIVCVVDPGCMLEGDDILWIMAHGQEVFKPINNLGYTKDAKYACRYIHRVVVDARWFEK